MARKKRDFKREILPDPKYHDLLVTRSVNVIMKSGKKSLAERAFYQALDIVNEKMKVDAIEQYRKAISNVRPIVEVRSRRVGGANYQVPTEVRADRSEGLAIRWIVTACNERSERGLAARLAAEIMDASQNRGAAVKKREDVHRMAEANKAFAHFKW